MFLSSLSYEQCKQFLGLAVETLSSDGEIDAEEENYLNGLCGEMSLSRNDGAENPQNSIASIFEGREVRQIVVLELLGLAYANHEYHPKELEYIEEVATLLNVDATYIQKSKDLIQKYGDLEVEMLALVRS